MNETTAIQKIDINDPITSLKMASVILQPVELKKVAELISDSNRENELVKYVDSLLKN